MFDYVRCVYPLPDAPKEIQDELFQTKTFVRPNLNKYVIQKNGSLVRHLNDRNGGFVRPEEMLKLTGELRFYISADTDEWFEYVALYDQGKLLVIRRVDE